VGKERKSRKRRRTRTRASNSGSERNRRNFEEGQGCVCVCFFFGCALVWVGWFGSGSLFPWEAQTATTTGIVVVISCSDTTRHDTTTPPSLLLSLPCISSIIGNDKRPLSSLPLSAIYFAIQLDNLAIENVCSTPSRPRRASTTASAWHKSSFLACVFAAV